MLLLAAAVGSFAMSTLVHFKNMGGGRACQDGDHTARFAAVIASCAANEAAGVANTMPQNLRELSDTNEAWQGLW